MDFVSEKSNKNLYSWIIHLDDGNEYNYNSVNCSLNEAIQKFSNIEKISFTSTDNKYPDVIFKYKPNREVIFGIYKLRNIEEWFAIKKDNIRPPDYFDFQIIGWMDRDTNRRVVIGINLATGAVNLQGE